MATPDESARRFFFLAPLIGFVIIMVAAGYYLIAGNDPRAVPSALINKPSPNIAINGLAVDGKQIRPGVSTSDFKGRITVLNFFASWCPPCLVEHPQIMALSKVDGVTVVGINYKNKPAKAAAWLMEHGNPYNRIGVDRSGDTGLEFGVRRVPETFLIDQQGRIRLKHVGAITRSVLKDTFLPAIRALKQ